MGYILYNSCTQLCAIISQPFFSALIAILHLLELAIDGVVYGGGHTNAVGGLTGVGNFLI